MQADRYETRARLEGHGVAVERVPDDERGAENRMAGERQLGAGCEDPDANISALRRREKEDGLGDIQLASEALHLRGAERSAVDEHAELVALQRFAREDVANDVRMKCRRAVPVEYARDDAGFRDHLTKPFS